MSKYEIFVGKLLTLKFCESRFAPRAIMILHVATLAKLCINDPMEWASSVMHYRDTILVEPVFTRAKSPKIVSCSWAEISSKFKCYSPCSSISDIYVEKYNWVKLAIPQRTLLQGHSPNLPLSWLATA
jgi:hypothetical protein